MKVWHTVQVGRADHRDVSEQAVQLACKRLLRVLGYAVYDLSQNRATMQTAGVSDLIAFKAGAPVLFVEVKRADGKASRAQQQFLAAAQAAGAVAVVAHSAAELAAQLGVLGG